MSQPNQELINAIAERLLVLKTNPCSGWMPESTTISTAAPQEVQPQHGIGVCSCQGVLPDPKYQAARELVSPIKYVNPPIDGWPDGAVRGLLEEVVEALGWEFGMNLKSNDGYYHYNSVLMRWWGDAPSLGQAILEVLNEMP